MTATAAPTPDTAIGRSPVLSTQLAAVENAPVTVASAAARLALSRAMLRSAMLPTPRTGAASGVSGQGVGGWAESLVERVRSLPGAGAIVETMQSWWDQHPLRPAGRIAAATARRFAGPIAERSPLKLVFAAAAFGAVLAILRPWRWLLRSAIFAGLVPALAMRAVRELPLDTLFDAFSSTFKGGAATSRSAGRARADRSGPVSNPAVSNPDIQQATAGVVPRTERARTPDTILR